jgi:hypothetical protein
LMVPSPLPLAICFPSGLHATEKTLRLSEVNKRIQRSREGKTSNLQIRVPGQGRFHKSRASITDHHQAPLCPRQS